MRLVQNPLIIDRHVALRVLCMVGDDRLKDETAQRRTSQSAAVEN